jgi:hypothetical protein
MTASPSLPVSQHVLSFYAVLHQLQALLATWTGTCIVCGQRIDSHARAPT